MELVTGLSYEAVTLKCWSEGLIIEVAEINKVDVERWDSLSLGSAHIPFDYLDQMFYKPQGF